MNRIFLRAANTAAYTFIFLALSFGHLLNGPSYSKQSLAPVSSIQPQYLKEVADNYLAQFDSESAALLPAPEAVVPYLIGYARKNGVLEEESQPYLRAAVRIGLTELENKEILKEINSLIAELYLETQGNFETESAENASILLEQIDQYFRANLGEEDLLQNLNNAYKRVASGLKERVEDPLIKTQYHFKPKTFTNDQNVASYLKPDAGRKENKAILEILRNRIYYKYFLTEQDHPFYFTQEEILRRARVAAGVLPEVERALLRLYKVVEEDEFGMIDEVIWEESSDAEGGDFAQYVRNNKIKSIYIKGSFLWGLGSEEGLSTPIPPGDIDFFIVVEDEQTEIREVITAFEFPGTQYFESGSRERKVNSIDMVITSTATLRKPLEEEPGELNQQLYGWLSSLWGSGLIVQGEEIVNWPELGHHNLLIKSKELTFLATIFMNEPNYRPRKAVNRIIEAILQANAAVEQYNREYSAYPEWQLEPVTLTEVRLFELFQALENVLNPVPVDPETLEASKQIIKDFIFEKNTSLLNLYKLWQKNETAIYKREVLPLLIREFKSYLAGNLAQQEEPEVTIEILFSPLVEEAI